MTRSQVGNAPGLVVGVPLSHVDRRQVPQHHAIAPILLSAYRYQPGTGPECVLNLRQMDVMLSTASWSNFTRFQISITSAHVPIGCSQHPNILRAVGQSDHIGCVTDRRPHASRGHIPDSMGDRTRPLSPSMSDGWLMLKFKMVSLHGKSATMIGFKFPD